MTEKTPPMRPRVSEGLRAARRRRLLEGAWYSFLSAGFLVVLVFGIASAAAVRPGFCGVCHGEQLQSVQAAEHASVSCDACHAGSSLFGLVESRLSLVEMGISHVISGGDSLESKVSNQTCRGCHEKQISEMVTAEGLKMSHRAIVKENWSCTRCHATSGHGAGGVRLTGYNMDMCLGCHSTNPANRATCIVCHNEDGNREGQPATPGVRGTTDAVEVSAPDPSQTKADALKPLKPKRPERSFSTPWEVTHGPEAERTHGMGNLQTCKACHVAQYCVDCHKMELPHPPNFIGRHGSSLTEKHYTPADCASCHEQSSCDSCHGLPMPHPGGFLKDHAETTGKLGQQACFTCHKERTCESCHIVHVHPGVPKEQLRALQNRPAR